MNTKNKSYMSKRKKEFLSTSGGVGVDVVDGDLGFAMRLFKRKVKMSGKLSEAYRRREFVKKSDKRRHELQAAIYREKKSNEGGGDR